MNALRNYKQMNVTSVYGTSRANAYRLFEDCLNQRFTQIYDTVIEDGREKRVLNQSETIAAREKQNKIREAFKAWIYKDPDRREELEATYNRLFNQIRLPKYDGSYLKFPEMNPAIELRPHQKDAVHRIITSGNTLLHHIVGSGKTYTMCAAAMKLRQYGLAKKPMIVVPNHLVQQWANEFRTLYPNAKLLIANKDDLTKENRKKFVSKVAMGDWDAVIIAQSSFAKINISRERQVEKVQEEIHAIEYSIRQATENGGRSSGSVKNLERIKKSREVQLKKLLDDTKKDNVLIFEDLGVDYLFVDEADAYKNLFLYTKMNNVAGITNAASARATDLQLKIEYINELHGGDKGIVFATGTPISNSMAEMYTMQTYLQRRTLQDLGIDYFDGWAADFGEAITALELAPSGKGYRAKTRFARFTNLPELLTLYHSFADVQTDIKLDTPEVERKVVTIKPTDSVLELTEIIAERADRIYGGGVDPHIDNMLKVTGDGKKLALDPRCLDPMVADEGETKLKACALNVFDEWKNSHEIKGTQLVFCDLSTPKTDADEYEYGKNFDAYNDLKYKLVELGIPKEQIAFIHEAKTDKQKQVLFDDVNAGKVRVLIGSTEKCGAGTNVQKRLVALHHLDAPYRPRDLTQRNGRGERQGNMNKNIRVYTYATERTFDSYSYQILENKQRFISQIERGDMTIRTAEDIDEATLSYAEIKAITSANPKIKQKMELDLEMMRLRELESRYKENLFNLQDKIRKEYPTQIQAQKLYLERVRADLAMIKENYNPEVFRINIGGVECTSLTEDGKKNGGVSLMEALFKNKTGVNVANYCGFNISLNPLDIIANERSITLAGSGSYKLEIGESASGNLTRLENFVKEFAGREERAVKRLEELENDFAIAKEQVEIPFEHQAQIEKISEELAELNEELNLNRREEVVIDDGAGDEESSEEHYMGLPSKNERGKKVTEKDYKFHLQMAENKANGDIVSFKDGYYRAVDNVADEFAEVLGREVNVVELKGKQIHTLAMDDEELEKGINILLGTGRTIGVVDMPKEEGSFIDTEDTVEEIETGLLPDYTVSIEEMNNYGYTWEDMLPLRAVMARQLYSMGVPVRLLDEMDSDELVTDGAFWTEEMYGVEKADWEKFIATEKGKAYLAQKQTVCRAALKVVNDDMSYVDGMYADILSNHFFKEEQALKEHLNADMVGGKEYIDEFVGYYAEQFPMPILKERYGWYEDDVVRAIKDKIEYQNQKKEEQSLKEIFGNRTAKEIEDLHLPDLDNHFCVECIPKIVSKIFIYGNGGIKVEFKDGQEYVEEVENAS